MVSSLIEASAPLKKPVAADKAMAASKKLQGHVPRRIHNQRARRRWGTVIFMLTIHVLTLFTLQAQFWSWLAFSGFGTYFGRILVFLRSIPTIETPRGTITPP